MALIAVIGAGAIGLSTCAFLSERGHRIRLWVRTGNESLHDFEIEASGALSWTGSVQASADLRKVVENANAVIVNLPANAHRCVMQQLAECVAPGQTVIVSAQYSLSGLYLAQELARHGKTDVTIVALATTMLTARRLDPHRVNVMTVRGQYGFATIPQRAEQAAAKLMSSLTGKDLTPVPMTEIVFGNPNPTAHAPNALCNLTRIENGEVWSNYGMMTETVCALIEALDTERQTIAKAFGADPIALTTHVHNSFGTPVGTMAEMSAHIVAARGGGPNGPTSLASRYITEDIAFGIVPVAWLAHRAGVEAPLHNAFITLFSHALRRAFDQENDLLPSIVIHDGTRGDIIDQLNGASPQAGNGTAAKAR